VQTKHERAGHFAQMLPARAAVDDPGSVMAAG